MKLIRPNSNPLINAIIVSAVTLYSYIVYVAGERGVLHAHGIAGLDAFIDLQPQDVVLGMLHAGSSMLYCLLVLAVSMTLLYMSRWPRTENGKNTMAMLLFCFVLYVTLSQYWLSTFGLVATLGIFTVLVMVFGVGPLLMRKTSTVHTVLDDFTDRVADFVLSDTTRTRKITMAVLCLLIIMMVPFVHYIRSYSAERS